MEVGKWGVGEMERRGNGGEDEGQGVFCRGLARQAHVGVMAECGGISTRGHQNAKA